MFTGNPLSTFIGKKIEAATRPELETDDWALNLEICDLINESDDDAKDAVRSIRKRLQQIEQDVNFTVTNRTLTVLETCVSNCSHRFHVLVMNKDFIQDLVKLIGPKNNPPIDLQERVLRLIERWAEAFRTQPDLSGVVTVYNELKAKGVTFPPADSGPNVPIQTPQRSVPPSERSPAGSARPSIRAPNARPESQQVYPPSSGPILLEGEGYEKISQDLQVVKTSIEMFTEIIQLIEMDNPDIDWQLASDLKSTCHQMKDRIVDLIERIANEDLTIELLRLNDDLINVFNRFKRAKDRHDSKAAKSGASSHNNSSSTVADASSSSRPGSTNNRPDSSVNAEGELSLIDFGTEDPALSRLDPFAPATTASTTIQQPKPKNAIANDTSGSDSKNSASNALPDEISTLREQDFAEIENWLSSDAGREATSNPSASNGEPTSISNSEFDKFIANRAMAGSSTNESNSRRTNSETAKPEPSV